MDHDNDNDTPKPTPHVTWDDAVEMHRLRERGFVQHAIAARFGVNQGRVSEVLRGRRHPGSRESALR